MKTSIQYLPLETRTQFACYHFPPQWRVDTEGPGMVCSLCGKPAPDIVFRICVTCGVQFVLKRNDPKWRPKFVTLQSGEVVESEFECATCY